MMNNGGENSNIDNNINKIENILKIKSENIDYTNYFMTLINEAILEGILSNHDMEDMEVHISDIFSDRIWQYTGGQSHSVEEEVAEEILKSVLCILDFFCIYSQTLNIIPNNDACTEVLREKAGIKNCYTKGLEYSDNIMESVKMLYNNVYLNKIETDVFAYNKTVNEALVLFVKTYNKYFFAHRVGTDICYKLLMDINLNGVLYVEEYLKNLYLENMFCSLFDKHDIKKLIQCYSINNRTKVYDLIDNIAGIIFTNAFFSLFLKFDRKNNPVRLFISKQEYDENIKDIFFHNSNIPALINNNTVKLILLLKIKNSELKNYIFKYQVKFTENVLSAVKYNYLHNFITLT